MVHILKNGYSLQEVLVLLSLLLGSVLNNMVEGSSIEYPKLSIFISLNSSSSWSIIEQSKFTENITSLVVLQEGVFFIQEFVAAEGSCFNNVKHITWLSLLDNSFTSGKRFLIHGFDDNFHVFFIVLMFVRVRAGLDIVPPQKGVPQSSRVFVLTAPATWWLTVPTILAVSVRLAPMQYSYLIVLQVLSRIFKEASGYFLVPNSIRSDKNRVLCGLPDMCLGGNVPPRYHRG